jgi:hypothetical protein
MAELPAEYRNEVYVDVLDMWMGGRSTESFRIFGGGELSKATTRMIGKLRVEYQTNPMETLGSGPMTRFRISGIESLGFVVNLFSVYFSFVGYIVCLRSLV